MEFVIHILGIVISSLTTAYIFYKYLNSLYIVKKTFHLSVVKIVILTCAVLSILVNIFDTIPFANFILTLAELFLLSILFYDYKPKQYILNNCLILLYLIFLDIFVITIYSAITFINVGQTLHASYEYFITSIIYSLLAIVSHKYIISCIKKYTLNSIKTKQFLIFVFAAFFEIFVVAYILKLIQSEKSGVVFFIIIIGFSILDYSILYLYQLVSKQAALEINLQLAKHQIDTTIKSFNTIEEKYLTSRRIYHDIRRHLSVVEELLKQNAEISTNYIDSLYNQIEMLKQKFWCSNQILNIIISDRLAIAEAQKISFDLDMEDINLDFMDNLDITILFSNIIDNAIEACFSVDNNYIKLKTRTKENYILISIENTHNYIINKSDNNFLSTKESHMGIGLSNVKDIIASYGGDLDITYDANMFRIEITLSDAQSAS
ncbi:Sensor histidine kinase YesM [Anaerocolumna xylanovorans DSM 12503]|uniref:Sensor histidine kinase YesM n=1 Tax=Anaerocolumna xylanovorans DSM 12503 TaxID=1121345 RepID=A0A1M7YIB2_9FIRM|nr:Sensor histidine kinase YesM [Anaerocolumna xylanovorans DSM 12503]